MPPPADLFILLGFYLSCAAARRSPRTLFDFPAYDRLSSTALVSSKQLKNCSALVSKHLHGLDDIGFLVLLGVLCSPLLRKLSAENQDLRDENIVESPLC